jgi:hypothetical protein
MTRESGRGPTCWQEPHPERSCGGIPLHAASRKSYLVLKAALGAYGAMIAQRWKYVAIAELNPDSLRIAQEQVTRHLRLIPTTAQDCAKRGEAVRELFGRLDAGLLSLPEHCTCAATGNARVCRGCRNLTVSKRRFVVQGRFLGYEPRGIDHWFSGLTDAVGDVAHMQLPWLRCCCRTTFPTCVLL